MNATYTPLDWFCFLSYMSGLLMLHWTVRALRRRREAIEARIIEPVDEAPAENRHTVFVDGRPDSF